MEPKGVQIGAKIHQKSSQKNDQIFKRKKVFFGGSAGELYGGSAGFAYPSGLEVKQAKAAKVAIPCGSGANSQNAKNIP